MIAAVTGANGFIGSRLSSTLSNFGHEVRRVIRTDFADDAFERKIQGADVLFHLAGATRAPTVAGLNSANVDLTRRVVAAAQAGGVRRLVFVSSQAAAGPARALDRPVSEDDLPAPVEAYGRSKLAAEHIVRESGLSAAIVRPGAVYGPGDKDFRTAFALAHRGWAIHPGNREQWMSIIHVDDCVQGILLAARLDLAAPEGADSSPGTPSQSHGAHSTGQPIYFLANDHPVQWSELFEAMARAAGGSLNVDMEIPMPLVRLAARAGDAAARLTGRAGLLTTEKVALGRAPFWVCSNARAKRELGFAPRVSLDDGLLQTYLWYLEHGGFGGKRRRL